MHDLKPTRPQCLWVRAHPLEWRGTLEHRCDEVAPRSSHLCEQRSAVRRDQLINGSLVFVQEAQQSRDKFMSSGQIVAIKGTTIG